MPKILKKSIEWSWCYTTNMQETTFEKELSLIAEGQRFIIGVDEAGRGPLAGPVVAAAVSYKDASFQIPPELSKEFVLIRDSKKLSPKQREKMFTFIQEHFYVGIGIVNEETIDRVNILQATFLAMKGAIADLRRTIYPVKSSAAGPQKAEFHRASNLQQNKDVERREPLSNKTMKPWYLLIDGNQEIPNCSYEQEAVIGGDGIVKSIAAASIVAKVTRDGIIVEYDKLYPGYGFAKHKGYGTKVHMDALRRLGPSPIHRMSFKPVLLALPENVNKRFANVLRTKKR